MHVRKGRHFVQDGQWYASYECYQDFMEKACAGNALLLEPGLGYDTPTIIRFPFEKMVRQEAGWFLVRLNLNEAVVPESLGERAVGINADLAGSIEDIRKLCAGTG